MLEGMPEMPDLATAADAAKNAQHVAVGFTWTSFFSAISGAGVLGILALIIRHIGPWRKQRDEAEQNLRVALTKRVRMLERKIELKDVKHEAERSLDRHKIRNLVQCLDAVLFVLEKAPDKTGEVVAEIRAMRERQIAEEIAEAAAIRAAELAATARLEREEHEDEAA